MLRASVRLPVRSQPDRSLHSRSRPMQGLKGAKGGGRQPIVVGYVIAGEHIIIMLL